MQTAQPLERRHRFVGRSAELAGNVAVRDQSRSTEPALQVTDRVAALPLRQREPAGQCVVARNSSSSWSRVPLLLAPTRRLETSPPENTSNVGMLITL